MLPPAYAGKVRVPTTHILYEHELRHTNQYGWLGPGFLVYYLIDAIVRGYQGIWTERDARDHSDGPDAPTEVVANGPGGGAVGHRPRWANGGSTGGRGGRRPCCAQERTGFSCPPPSPGSTRPWDFTRPVRGQRRRRRRGGVQRRRTPAARRPARHPGLFSAGHGGGRHRWPRSGRRARAEGRGQRARRARAVAAAARPADGRLPAQAGLPQGAALWNNPAGPGDALTVVENSPAPDPGAARPGTRGLRVRGDVDATATAVRVRLLTPAGQPVALAPDAAGQPRTEVTATLAAPGPATGPGAGRRQFEAVLELADPAAPSARSISGCVVDTPTGLVAEAFTGQLCGLQLALVDDPHRRSPVRRPARPTRSWSSTSTPARRSHPALLGDQARARRMVRYPIANEMRPLPARWTHRPCGLACRCGWARSSSSGSPARDLEDLLRRRADRRGTPPSAPAGPLTTRISFRWRMRLSWDGPDSGSATFGRTVPATEPVARLHPRPASAARRSPPSCRTTTTAG